MSTSSDSPSLGWKPIAFVGILLVLAAGLWLSLRETSSAPGREQNAKVERTKRPLNTSPPRQRRKNQVASVPIKLPPKLQKRVRGPRVKDALAPTDTKAQPAGDTKEAPKAEEAEEPAQQKALDETPPTAAPKRPTGTLSRESIQAGIKAIKPQIKECFEQGLQQNPSLAGRVTITFEIEADEDGNGKVMSGTVKDSEVQSPFFEACVLKQVGGQTFDAPEGGGMVRVTYPFNFDPGGGFGGTERDRNGESE